MSLATPPSAEVLTDLDTGETFAVVTAGPEWLMSELEDTATEALIELLERPARAQLLTVAELGDGTTYRATYTAAEVRS